MNEWLRCPEADLAQVRGSRGLIGRGGGGSVHAHAHPFNYNLGETRVFANYPWRRSAKVSECCTEISFPLMGERLV